MQRLSQQLQPLRDALLNHPIYEQLDRVESLRRFMEHHVFAVWDFMSLLKTLQRQLCCVAVPWIPADDSTACRLVNEIVLAEESDENRQGGFASHFDLYHHSMKQFGARTESIDNFLACLKNGQALEDSFNTSRIPQPAKDFVRSTFAVIESNDLCAIASAFTFGREDLLPEVFQRIVDRLNVEAGGQLNDFKYYLERHIGLDSDEHGPMAARLIESLCGSQNSRWQAAENAAVNSLVARKKLWDGIHESIRRET